MRQVLAKEWEFTKLSISFLSIIVTGVMMAFITLLFAGHIDKAHLDGVGLANTLYGVFVLAVSSGYSSVFDTYGPQVHGSAESSELGTVLVKCLLQGGLVHLIILGPYLNLVYVIDMLPTEGLHSGEETIVADDFRDIAVQYLRLTVFVEYLDYAVMMISKYFAVQGQTKFVYIVSGAMIATHVAANYGLVSVLNMGVNGLGIAAIIGRAVPLAVSLLICIVKVKREEFVWSGIGFKTLIGWKPMVKLGVSGAINCFAEMALYEISTFCSQFDGRNALSVIIILVQILSIWWAITFGIARTAATLIGTALGNGNVKNVKLYIKLTLVNTALESVPLAFISYFLRRYLVQIFSNDEQIMDLYDGTFWLACLGLPINHFMNSLNQGILVAFGRQKFIAWTMSIACYGIGLPFIILTIFFTDLGVTGVILGWILSDTATLLTGAAKIWRIDIEKEMEKTKLRVSRDLPFRADGERPGNIAAPVYKVSDQDLIICARKSEDILCQGHVNMGMEEGEVENAAAEDSTDIGQNETDIADSREPRNVMIAYITAAIVCVTLGSVSFIR